MKKILFCLLIIFVLIPAASAACMSSPLYNAEITNINDFPQYAFVSHVKDGRSGKQSYQIIGENGTALINNEYKTIYILQVYAIEKSEFNEGNITVERGYYIFEESVGYIPLDMSFSGWLFPCGQEEYYPELREDYFEVVSSDPPAVELKKTVWIFQDGSNVTVDSPSEDSRMPNKLGDNYGTMFLFSLNSFLGNIPPILFIPGVIIVIIVVLLLVKKWLK